MGEREVLSPGVGPQGDATARPGGVGGQPTAPPQGVDQEAQPTAEGEQPQEAPPAPGKAINLDDVPEFRRWKSNYDSRMAQAERRAQEAEQRAAQIASRLEELELRELRPDEQAAWYKTKLAEERASLERQRQDIQVQQQYAREASEALAELGLDPQTPGLDWGEGPSPENMIRLMRSAARIVAERTRQQSQAQAAQTEEQVRDARIGALREAGVTRTSMATTGAPPESNPIANITDLSTLLEMGIEAEEKKGGQLRG